MKPFFLPLTILLLSLKIQAQTVKIISTEQRSHMLTYEPIRESQGIQASERELLQAPPILPVGTHSSSFSAKTSGPVSPVPLGRASNAFTILRTVQNQVWANSGYGMIAFIHRQDVTIWGGGGTANGKYRYDLSTDGGQTFTADIGALQQQYLQYGRYPNIAGHITNWNGNPFQTDLVWGGATTFFPAPGWFGHVYGYARTTASPPVTTTENYHFAGQSNFIPGGLTQGLPGEFWTVELADDGTDFVDSINIKKGVFNPGTNDVDWVHHGAPVLNSLKDASGYPEAGIGPNIAFSPDGMTGWIAMLGDLVGGADSVYSPIFLKSSDGGATWGAPLSLDLGTFSAVVDTLTGTWVLDAQGTPAGNGRPTTAFDYDLTVDINGNPHLGVVIANSGTNGEPITGWSVASGYEKFLADITSTDGGSSWEVRYIAPVLTFRGEWGVPDQNGQLLPMDNYVQVSRNESGTEIFFSWADSDTTLPDGLGFGESDNTAPDLRIVGYRVTDGYRTCTRRITDGDNVWGGSILFPTMAPTVLSEGTRRKLPIVFLKMMQGDQNGPCQFYYLGNDAQIDDGDFVDPAQLDLRWDAYCGLVNQTPPVQARENVLHPPYPNPSADYPVVVSFSLKAKQEIELFIQDIRGKQIQSLASGEFTAREHQVTLDSRSLSPGLYLCTLKTGSDYQTQKIAITR